MKCLLNITIKPEGKLNDCRKKNKISKDVSLEIWELVTGIFHMFYW